MKKKSAVLTLAAVTAAAVPSQAFAEETPDAVSILEESNKAMMELESYSSETMMEQTVTDPMMEGGSFTTTTHSTEDVVMNPFSMKQTATTSMEGEEDTTLDSYWTEDGFYQQDVDGSWIKLDDSFTGDINELMAMSQSGAQMEQTAALGEDMSVEDAGDSYVLTYEGEGDELMESAEEMLASLMPEEDTGMMAATIFEDITVNDLEYVMTIDKETHYMTETTMDIDMDLSIEEESINIVQSLDMSVFNFNGVDEIVVPEDVVNSAVPMDALIEEEMEEGGALPDTATNNPFYAAAGALAAAAAGGMLFFRRRFARS